VPSREARERLKITFFKREMQVRQEAQAKAGVMEGPKVRN
jgi:hypothetical protein